MAVFSQEFKVQSVEKALSRNPEQSLKALANDLGVGYSTLQKWIRLARDNQPEISTSSMSKEKSPHAWTKAERFDAIAHCHHLTDEQASAYCREKGIYLHHPDAWRTEFLSAAQSADLSASRAEKKQLKQENKRLQKELNRKEKALSETAALLVLSKKCQAIRGEKADD